MTESGPRASSRDKAYKIGVSLIEDYKRGGGAREGGAGLGSAPGSRAAGHASARSPAGPASRLSRGPQQGAGPRSRLSRGPQPASRFSRDPQRDGQLGRAAQARGRAGAQWCGWCVGAKPGRHTQRKEPSVLTQRALMQSGDAAAASSHSLMSGESGGDAAA